MDDRAPVGRTTHNLSLDAETSEALVRLVRRRFNLPDDKDLPRGVVSWFIVELIQGKAAESRELAAVS